MKQTQKIELQAQKRIVLGAKVEKLRKDGVLPAVLYGKGQEALSLQVPLKDFERVLKSAGESTLVYLNLDGAEYPTIIHDVSRDPVKGAPVHADFYKVRLDEKVRANVPVVFIGVSLAVKDLSGIFVRNVNELEVEAFPQNLPHEITVDISLLARFGDQILLRDVNAGDGVKVLGKEDEIVATVQAPKSEEEIAAEMAQPATDVSAVEEIKKEKEEEVPEQQETSDEK